MTGEAVGVEPSVAPSTRRVARAALGGAAAQVGIVAGRTVVNAPAGVRIREHVLPGRAARAVGGNTHTGLARGVTRVAATMSKLRRVACDRWRAWQVARMPSDLEAVGCVRLEAQACSGARRRVARQLGIVPRLKRHSGGEGDNNLGAREPRADRDARNKRLRGGGAAHQLPPKGGACALLGSELVEELGQLARAHAQPARLPLVAFGAGRAACLECGVACGTADVAGGARARGVGKLAGWARVEARALARLLLVEVWQRGGEVAAGARDGRRVGAG
jgi:hypothetical protein